MENQKLDESSPMQTGMKIAFGFLMSMIVTVVVLLMGINEDYWSFFFVILLIQMELSLVSPKIWEKWMKKKLEKTHAGVRFLDVGLDRLIGFDWATEDSNNPNSFHLRLTKPYLWQGTLYKQIQVSLNKPFGKLTFDVAPVFMEQEQVLIDAPVMEIKTRKIEINADAEMGVEGTV
jgi:hypothetical protein